MPFLEFSHPSEGKEKITLDSRWGLGGGHSESFGKGTSTSSKGGGPSPVKLPRHEAESVSARNNPIHFPKGKRVEFTPEEPMQEFPQAVELSGKRKLPAPQNSQSSSRNAESNPMPEAFRGASPAFAPGKSCNASLNFSSNSSSVSFFIISPNSASSDF